MPQIKLVAIDMDGTLLNSKDVISPLTNKIIKQAAEQGIYIVLCSGRSFEGLARFLEQLELSGNQQYVITYNGGIVRTIAGKILEQNLLNKKDFDKLRVFSANAKIGYNVLDDYGNVFTTDNYLNKYMILQAWENSTGIRYYNSMADVPEDFVMAKGLITGEPAELDDVENAFKAEFSGQEYECVRSTPCFLELLNSQATKGIALRKLAEDLKINPEEVMAIGDELNDLSMLEYAGYSVAMGNASETIKSISKYQTDDHDHDGVGQAIEKLVLKNE